MSHHKPIKKSSLLFDTNILYRFAPYFSGPELKRILWLCSTLDIQPCTTDLVLRELNHLCRERLDSTKSQIVGNLRYLKGFELFINENVTKLIKEEKINLMEFLKKKMEKLNVTILTTCEHSQKELIDMAVSHTSPFESGDKGFKDSVILFTYLKHLASLEEKTAYLLSDDKIFRDADIQEIARKYDIGLIVFSDTKQAIDELSQSLDKDVKEHYAERENKIRQFLETKLPEILEYIKSLGFSEHFFQKSGKYPINAFLIKINDIHVERVARVIISGESQIDSKTKIEFLFMVETTFFLLVKLYSIARLFKPYYYLKDSWHDILTEGEEKTKELPLKTGINISATLLYDKNLKQYSDLQITEHTAYFL